MNIKRFFGKNSREALNLVRQELGEDAVILSNRAINGGNEISAVYEHELHTMHHAKQETELPTTSSNPILSNEPFDDEEIPINQNQYSNATDLLSYINQQAKSNTQDVVNPPSEIDKIIHETHQNLESARNSLSKQEELMLKTLIEQNFTEVNVELNQKIGQMLDEIRNMRSRVESQFSAMSWNNHLQNNPVKSKVLSMLLAANFSASLARQLAEKLPSLTDLANATNWVKETLSQQLNTIEDESEILDQGGVFALVGPTGVGKTTTTAKLAARYVMKHGTQNLGLITTDGYRIGGHEQLRIYGKILGVMVYAVKDEADLKIALNELKHKHTILIDTIGVSQRDQMVTEQIAMLSNANVSIKKLLCLNATCTGDTLTDVIRAYKGRALDGCIMTKLDESASIGNTLDVIIREKLRLYYTTNGQRVPEDIQVADKETLISTALTLQSTSWPFQYLDEELPFVISNIEHRPTIAQKSEVSYV